MPEPACDERGLVTCEGGLAPDVRYPVEGGEPEGVIATCGDVWTARCTATGISVHSWTPTCPGGCPEGHGPAMCLTIPCDGEWHSGPGGAP